MTTRIYHNPRCSKSRGALALVAERDSDVEVVRYLDEPPTADELGRLCEALDLEPTDIVRRKEKRFRELGLSLGDDRRRAEWLEILAANPVLIERPIVVRGGRAAIGRPPENVLELF